MKRFIAFLLVLILVFSFSVSVHADGLTMAMVGGSAFALMRSWGVGFSALNADGIGMRSFMESAIENYVNQRGGSLESLFGGEAARIVAGKMIIGQQLYNGIVNFYEYLKEEFGETNLSDGTIADITTGQLIDSDGTTPENIGCVFSGVRTIKINPGAVDKQGYSYVRAYYNGSIVKQQDPLGSDRIFTGFWSLNKKPDLGENRFAIEAQSWRAYQTEPYFTTLYMFDAYPDNVLGWDTSQAVSPTVLNPDKEWSGTIGGEDWPDTNIDELIGTIYDDVGLNDLEVEGEIVDPVFPPTPVPTVAPDIPLQDVPWEGLNDLIGSSTDTIDDAIQDQTEAITDAQEATTEAVESLTETIEGALDTPTSEELPQFKFDLRELFPFCIPFDIYRLLSSFDAEPVAPHVQLPIVIQSIGFSYTLDLDFSAWNPVAQAMRTAELIVYAIALAWATGKVIKW